ncbi:MAG: hypothetical protein QF860_09305, partial [Planctomycetota bacterium]|nr:hypothetical protein [Planctomycetota bacterium]
DYGPDFRIDDQDCDCLDNDCDGVMDGTGGRLAGCTIDDLVGAPLERDCRVQVSSAAAGFSYEFGSLTIPEGVSVVASAQPQDPRCYPGFAGGVGAAGCAAPEGGGCLRITVRRTLTVEGELSADGAPACDEAVANGGASGGGSGGSISIVADEVVVAPTGVVRADGGRGSWWPILRGKESGAGAAGLVIVTAFASRIAGQVVARGGDAWADIGAGRGTSGTGGEGGGQGGAGGGGSGGPGGGNGWTARPGPASAGRFTSFAGDIEVLPGGVLGSFAGNELGATGQVRLWGEALGLQAVVGGDEFTTFPLLMWLSTQSLEPLAGLPVRVFDAVLDRGPEPFESLEHGLLYPDFRFTRANRYRIEVADPAASGALLRVTYGDEDGRRCSVRLTLEGDPPGADVPAECTTVPQ